MDNLDATTHQNYVSKEKDLIRTNQSDINKIILYPNPTKDVLNIVIPIIEGEKEMIIIDINGKIIQRLKSSLEKIMLNTNHFANGIYYIKIKTKDSVLTKSFIKIE